MSRQVCNGRFVDASSRVNVHRIDNLVRWLRILLSLVLILILARGRQQ